MSYESTLAHDRRIEIEYRTEERLGILLQGSPASLRQQFDAKQAAIAEVDALTAAQSDLSPIKSRLEAIYGPRRWQYAEDCLLLDIIRSPNALAECETIIRHYNSLTPAKRQFFPQGVYALISRWYEILDRARMAERNGSIADVSPNAQKKAIVELMAAHPCNPDATAYDDRANQEQRAQWKALKLKLVAINLQIAGFEKT